MRALTGLVLLLCLTLSSPSGAFTYVGTNRGVTPPETVVHPCGYEGKGGEIVVRLALHPEFAHLEAEFQFAGEYAAAVWNLLASTTGTLEPSIEIPAQGGTDVLGTLTHEFGHTLGLAHPTFVPPNGIRSARVRGKFATALPGPNGEFDLAVGEDGLRGSADDVRGDDVNLMWFKKEDNNPFTLPESGIIDSTTYSRELADLPEGDNSPVVPSRENAEAIYELADTEAMMVSGGSLIPAQVRRSLGADDVAGIRFAMSGVDEIQGTDDDYTLRLEYVGVSDDAEVLIRVDMPEGYAAAAVGSRGIAPNHRAMTPKRIITYNPDLPGNRTWHFPYPEPISAEVRELNPRAMSLNFETEIGKRYVITWPDLEGVLPEAIQHDGESVQPSTARHYFFIASSSKSEVKIAFQTEMVPDFEAVQAGELRTREL